MDFSRALREIVWILLSEGTTSECRLRHEVDLPGDQFDAIIKELVEIKGWAELPEPGLVAWSGREHQARTSVLTIEASEDSPLREPEQMPEGERRQVTVMFCDLADSTRLSTKLDPEDMNDLIAAYQRVVTPIIQQFDGYVAKYMGDGVLAYFGYPLAREKDAQRAILASLSVIEAIRDFRFKDAQEISVRIGIATGTVVVGETIGEGDARERMIAGETPNLAARLQALAAPNGIIISEVTRELAGNAFDLHSLGKQELKGIDSPVEVWEVSAEAQDEFDVETGNDEKATPLIGRQAELGLLTRAWQQSREGGGQVVTISGEAGIGKSRLVEAITELALKDGAVCVSLRCSPHLQNSALSPVISQLRRVMGWNNGDDSAAKLTKMESALARFKFVTGETVPLLAALLSIPLPDGEYPELKLSPQQQRVDTLDTIVAWLLEEAEKQPVISIWEDLHWADPTTLELFNMMIEQCPTAPILNVATFRSEFAPTWPSRSHIVPITLNRLEAPEVESLILQQSRDKPLPADVVAHITARGDGVPLYVGELTRTILSSGLLTETDDAYELDGPLDDLAIPATLQDSLLARLDRAPLVREVAQLGSVFGREFPYELVKAVGAIDEATLQNGLERLVQEELLYRRGRLPRSKYMFKHALIQDAAYQSLLKRTRQHYHKAIAEMLIRQFPEIVETQPEILAHHFSEAGEIDQASNYWLNAGQQALRRSENYEAIGHLKKGLAILPKTEDSAVMELAMLRQLGTAYMATKGYGAPETVQTFDCARKLCGVVKDNSIYPVMFGVWLAALVQARHANAKEMIEEMNELAAGSDDSFAPYAAHCMSAFTYLHTGELKRAESEFDASFAIQNAFDDEQKTNNALLYGLDIEVANHAYGAWFEWLVGHPDKALRSCNKAMAAIEISRQGYTLARGLYWCAVVNQFLGRWDEVARLTDKAVEHAKVHGMAMVVSVCKILQLSADAELNGVRNQADEIGDAIDDYRATGARFQLPYHYALQANLLLKGNRLKDGLDIVRKAQHLVQETGETYFLPELLRLKGELFLAGQSPDRARACFEEAIVIAEKQGGLSLALRACTSLARMLTEEGDDHGARNLLEPIVERFTEGFKTRDLTTATALLGALADRTAAQ